MVDRKRGPPYLAVRVSFLYMEIYKDMIFLRYFSVKGKTEGLLVRRLPHTKHVSKV